MLFTVYTTRDYRQEKSRRLIHIRNGVKSRIRVMHHKSVDDAGVVEHAGNVQRTESAAVLYIDGGLVDRQQCVETGWFVCKLHRAVVRRRPVTAAYCVQMIHLTI